MLLRRKIGCNVPLLYFVRPVRISWNPLFAQAVNRVPIFAPLSMEQKRLVTNAMVEVRFRPGLYICEEVSQLSGVQRQGSRSGESYV